jgi:hypothetical protein
MTDAYGAIVVCGDYEGNVKAIADALNRLKWSDDAGFVASEDGRVTLDGYCVQYPTVYASRDIYVFKDGRRIFSDEADESVIEEWENEDGELDNESYSLEELSDLISPHLTKGTIELVAIGQESGCCYSYCGRLAIRSDRSAERQNWADGNLGAECSVERYDPKKKSTTLVRSLAASDPL